MSPAGVCVVGMHRSGTSLTMQVLTRLGLSLGPEQTLVPTDADDNPNGYFEQQAFVSLNDELLDLLGGHTSEPPRMPEGWERGSRMARHRRRAAELVETTFDGSPWGWKDPRASLLLPLWREVVPGLRVVVCVRNPLEVAASMVRRRLDSYDRRHWLRNWLRYTADALRDSAGADRLVVIYEDLMAEPERQVRRLARFLLAAECDPGLVAEASAAVRPALRRGWSSDARLTGDPGIPEVASAYLAVREAVREDRSLEEVTQVVEGLRRALRERERPAARRPPGPGGTKAARVTGLLVVRDEADILRLCVLHHLFAGCERILALDNGSTDATVPLLRRLAARLPVLWSSDPGPFHPAELATGLAGEATRLGADWVLPLDADEFWAAPEGLPAVLGGFTRESAVGAERVEFIQRLRQRRPTPAAVLTMRMRVPAPALAAEDAPALAAGERSTFEFGRTPKQALRASQGLVVEGNESAATSGAVTILHAPLRSRRCLARKAEHGERLERAGYEGQEGWRVRQLAALARTGRLDEAWRAHAYSQDGTLRVDGRSVPLEYDDRLAATLGHLVRPTAKQLAARALRRTF